mmetsp:Transcript_13354/g.32689  ORF Transcript_13354/g.32689 Transcript_13354/m.32689 type:complete len:210 (+) Transcript_13354:1108-1737(+)
MAVFTSTGSEGGVSSAAASPPAPSPACASSPASAAAVASSSWKAVAGTAGVAAGLTTALRPISRSEVVPSPSPSPSPSAAAGSVLGKASICSFKLDAVSSSSLLGYAPQGNGVFPSTSFPSFPVNFHAPLHGLLSAGNSRTWPPLPSHISASSNLLKIDTVVHTFKFPDIAFLTLAAVDSPSSSFFSRSSSMAFPFRFGPFAGKYASAS